MEEIISMIFQGCKLAKELESSTPNMANQPETLLKSCEDIAKTFFSAKERLNNYILLRDHRQRQGLPVQQVDASVMEWLKSSYSSAMELMLLQGTSTGIGVSSASGVAFVDTSDSAAAAGSFSQRRQRRRDEEERRTVKMPAPQIGNTEIPPDDGFTWRKYGQKEILGSKFPRSYYRCTHQKLYNCPAKRQVQRLDNDPLIFEITYRGNHTCHMSATAPIPQDITQPTTTTSLASTEPRWLEFSLGGDGSSGSGRGGGSGGAGPSTVRYGRELEYPVTDLADAMFDYSRSSSGNSIEFIFKNMEDHKWQQNQQQQEKKSDEDS